MNPDSRLRELETYLYVPDVPRLFRVFAHDTALRRRKEVFQVRLSTLKHKPNWFNFANHHKIRYDGLTY
ncbi:MAG: hypothetical protein JWR25_2264 [Noviherbaspirillum sp.]|nr:hypothetical protein [Noviherbaspirillum sp.]